MIKSKPAVYIVDDDDAIRKALKLLMKSAGLEAEVHASAKSFLDSYEGCVCGCLLLDVRMPGMSGLELQKLLVNQQINIPVIIMTGHGDIAMAVQTMKDGAFDFIEKPFDNQALVERVQAALEQASDAESRDSHREEVLSRFARLTPREREIMDSLVGGKRNKVIAAELGISTRTVEAHRAKIMEKMGARSLSEIVRMNLGH